MLQLLPQIKELLADSVSVNYCAPIIIFTLPDRSFTFAETFVNHLNRCTNVVHVDPKVGPVSGAGDVSAIQFRGDSVQRVSGVSTHMDTVVPGVLNPVGRHLLAPCRNYGRE
jgi:hypothetical protein